MRDAAFAEESLPRSNGRLAFDAPWQARVHALAVLTVEALGREWEEFRHHLIEALDHGEERLYWDSWVSALEAFVAESGVLVDSFAP